MPFYAAPLYNNVSVRLVGGYTPPNPVGGIKTLDSTGRYAYKPSHYNSVNAELLSGYILPSPVGQSKTLIRFEYSGALPQTISVSGEEYLEIGTSRADLKILYIVPIGVEHPSIGNVHIRNQSEKIYVNHNYTPSTFTQAMLSANYQTSTSAYLTRPGNYNVFGFLSINNKNRVVATEGKDLSDFGSSKIILAERKISVSGFVASGIGTPFVQDTAIKPSSIDSLIFSKPTIYNLRQYVRNGGIPPFELGIAFVQGGKRFLTVPGFYSFLSGGNKITREREIQYADLNGKGIAAIAPGQPRVDPRILYPGPFVATLWGTAKVQRNPSPLGFVNTRYGSAWVSFGQRFLLPPGFNAFEQGYPKVFDPTQTIIQQLTKIPGGIFGDTHLRNKNYYVNVEGSLQSIFSDWAFVESNLRYVVGRTDNKFTIFGVTAIHNKTPSLIPKGMTGFIGNHHISFFRRSVIVPGFVQYALGRPTLSKTPQIDPQGFNAQLFGNAFISNYYRELGAAGLNGLKMGEPIVWHRVRYVGGIADLGVASTGKPVLTLGLRELLAKGSDHGLYGQPVFSFRVRTLKPDSIVEIFRTNHIVGGTQFLIPKGFAATRFGERIIPVSQTINALGFTGIYSIPSVKNYKSYVRPFGFSSENIAIHGRWGKAKTFNSRQYVTMFYDVDSELNPPKENSKWLNVINRNRTMQFYGSTATIYGRPSIANKAVAILPPGIDSAAVDKQRISHYRQVVKIESMEPPYISGWSNVSNDAKVVDAKQFNSAIFGNASLENTRKFYKIQGYENQVLGYPMVAFKIRELTFENRYSIAPVRIELPRVQLWIRYVEPVSIFKEAFGSIELFRYQGRLTTRWAHKEYTGEPIIRNVTPELRVWSMLSEEFGKPSIELLRRYVTKDGFVATLLPKPRIEFKTRNLQMQSIPALNISQKHVLERTGSQPYAKQWISLEHPDVGYYEDVSSTIGYGIPIPGKSHHGMAATDPEQVSKPTMNQMVIRQLHINDNNGDMARMGNPMMSANTVRIDSGIGAFDAGEAFVSLKNRRIVVEEFPNSEVFQPSPAALSPWTIYAVVEAPEQARRNHPDSGGSPHLVRSESVVGYPTLTLRHRKVAQYGSNQSLFGATSIMLYRRYIKVSGFNTFRFGFHSIPEWIRTLEQHTSRDVSLYGYPEVSRPKDLVKLSISPRGINEPLINAPLIQFFHRKFQMNGIDSAKFGASVKGDADYYPQHLHVGFKKPVIPQGTDCAKYGKNLISYLHRQVSVEGFNTFVSTYTIEKFKERLKVTLVKKPQVITNQVIGVLGIENQNYSTPDIKLAVHYIRPDGNSDQFRKGAPQ